MLIIVVLQVFHQSFGHILAKLLDKFMFFSVFSVNTWSVHLNSCLHSEYKQVYVRVRVCEKGGLGGRNEKPELLH